MTRQNLGGAEPAPTVLVALTWALLFAVVACQGGAAEVDETDVWIGTVTTEGNVTTVVNESGSVWGGAPELVEEASIGVEAGGDEYMLGEVAGLAATTDKIFVIDRQVPALRVYDHRGVYLYDIGAPGQGPGEFQEPSSIAIASDGRLFLRDDDAHRIWMYSQAGEYLGAYQMAGGLHTSTPLTLSPDDVPYTPVVVRLQVQDPRRMFVLAMQAHGEDGAYGVQILPPIDETFTPGVASNEQGSVQRNVPFYPAEQWALTPELGLVSGVSRSYRFEVRHADGSTLVVERTGEPVPVDAAEADWNKRRTTAIMRDILPEWVWGDTPGVPARKPAFDEFIPTHSAEIWVLRPGPGIRLPDCDDEAETSEEFAAYPCWRDRRVVDIFGDDGRLLGSFEPPADMRFSPRPYIDGDLVIARAEDDDAMSMVKRYRLVWSQEQ